VHLTTVASLSIDVEIDGDTDDLRAEAIDAAYDALPGQICAQCSGWSHGWSREVGDEWEVAEQGGVILWHDDEPRDAEATP
jgi:hypothetical protein